MKNEPRRKLTLDLHSVPSQRSNESAWGISMAHWTARAKRTRASRKRQRARAQSNARSFIRTVNRFRGAPDAARSIGSNLITGGIGNAMIPRRNVPKRASRGQWARDAMGGRGRGGGNPDAPGLGLWPFGGQPRSPRLRRFLNDSTGFVRSTKEWRLRNAVRDMTREMGPMLRSFAPFTWLDVTAPNLGSCLNCGPFNFVDTPDVGCALTCGNRYVVTNAQVRSYNPADTEWTGYWDDGTTFGNSKYPILRYNVLTSQNTYRVPAGAARPLAYGRPTMLGFPVALPETYAPMPVAVPRRHKPYVGPLLGEGLPQGYDATGPEGNNPPRERPVPIASVSPAPGSGLPPVGVVGEPPGTAPTSPPGGKDREKKRPSAAGRVLGGTISGISEGRDLVDALWRSLPKKKRRARPGDTAAQARDLYNNWGSVSVSDAAVNLIANEVEDRIVGRAARRARDAGRLSSGAQNALMGHYVSHRR